MVRAMQTQPRLLRRPDQTFFYSRVPSAMFAKVKTFLNCSKEPYTHPLNINTMHESRCVGTMLWSACADALGAAVEGQTHEQVLRSYPHGLVEYIHSDRGYGAYTDDTQMTLALACALVQSGRLDPAAASHMYASRFQRTRGYGQTAAKVLEDLKSGAADWRTSGRKYMPEGSFANGGAMRIAPVGLAYRHAPPGVLRHAVEGALVCTHVHPEAIDGAVVTAAAVGWLCRLPGPGNDSAEAWRQLGFAEGAPSRTHLRSALLSEVLQHAQTEEMRGRLEALISVVSGMPDVIAIPPVCTPDPNTPHCLHQTWEHHLQSTDWQQELKHLDQLQSTWFQIRAVDAVAVSLSAFLHHGFGPQPASAVVAAAHYGGDTDTIAAIVGALVGAYHGACVPAAWYEGLEDDHEHGRAGIVSTARQLAALDVRG